MLFEVVEFTSTSTGVGTSIDAGSPAGLRLDVSEYPSPFKLTI